MPQRRRFPVKLAALLGFILLLVLVFSLLDLSPNLDRLDATMLSGPEQGHYHEVVDRLSARAERDGGSLDNLATVGSVDNLARLAAASSSCEAEFAVVQDGIPAPPGAKIELIARLRRSESMFFLGRNAATLTQFEQLRGLSIGLGPEHSGTDNLARRILESPELAGLGARLSNHDLAEQVALLESGELDLGVFVVDEDANIIRDAVRNRGLEIASFEHTDAVARKHDFLSYGRIAAGQYDLIKILPAADRRVFRVGTLIVGNGCADHAENVALLSVLNQELPDLLAHNRASGHSNLFDLNSSAERFYTEGGPGFADLHAPWLVSIMPPSNWVYVAMVISIFINLTTAWHRFRLWRLDANTDKADAVVREVIGETLTPIEMVALEPEPKHCTGAALAQLDRALESLDELRRKCRRQANSLLVPMGSEWIYRYTEQQMEETLTAMRKFRARAGVANEDSADDDGDHTS